MKLHNIIFGLIFTIVFIYGLTQISGWGPIFLWCFGAVIVLGIWIAIIEANEIDNKHNI